MRYDSISYRGKHIKIYLSHSSVHTYLSQKSTQKCGTLMMVMMINRGQRPHIVVTVEDLKAIHDFLGTGSSSNVQEVGWLSSVQFDDVHRGHCQSCSIHWTCKGHIWLVHMYKATTNMYLFAVTYPQALCRMKVTI